jgi:hypothetical protein
MSRGWLPQIPVSWLTPEGRLDKGKLLATLLDFWAQHGEPLLRTAPFPEIAPHLVLMAFLSPHGQRRLDRARGGW